MALCVSARARGIGVMRARDWTGLDATRPRAAQERTVTRDEVLLVRRKEVPGAPGVALLPVPRELCVLCSPPAGPQRCSPLPDGKLERQEVSGGNELLCSVSLLRSKIRAHRE